MRIGNVSPRINGIVSLGSLGAGPDLLGQATMYFNSFMDDLAIGGMAQPPDVVAETLTQAVKDSCAAANSMIGSTGNCDPSSVAPQIAAMVQQYTDAYNKAGAAVSTVSPSQVQYSSQPTNALDRVTPQTSMISTPVPVNTLAPPVTQAPVQSINTGTFTGTQTTAAPAGSTQQTAPAATSASFFDQTIAIGSLNIPTWVLLAGAGVGLFLMTKGKR